MKNFNIVMVKDFYDKNRQKILTVFIIICFVFFIFYWTGHLFGNKKKEYLSSAKSDYARLVDVVSKQAEINASKGSASKNRMDKSGLLAFVQNTGSDVGIGQKLVNIRPISSTGKIEQVSLRIENLYYDEFINFIAKIEVYDNLYIKNISFNRRYDNPSMIDVSMEIVKS